MADGTEEEAAARAAWEDALKAAHTSLMDGLLTLEQVKVESEELAQSILRLKESLSWLKQIGHDGRWSE